MQSTFSFACMDAYQFKIFPVGVSKDKIITVDVKISRTMAQSDQLGSKNRLKETGKFEVMWILNSYISSYDKHQKLISSTSLEKKNSIGKSYSDTLNKTFQHGLAKIATTFFDIEYFKPEYISFCDFQQKCNIVQIQSDTILNKDYVVYDDRKYETVFIKDTLFYGFESNCMYHPKKITDLFVNSVRVYRAKSISLLITHLATADEISWGWITSDPKKAGKTEDGEISLAKEYKPNLTFSELQKSTYEEPLLHHGYGFDLFIIK